MALTFTVLEAGYNNVNKALYNLNDSDGVNVTGDGVVTLTAGRLYYIFIAADRSGGTAACDVVRHDPSGTPLAFSLVTGSFQATPVGDTGVQVWKVVPGSTTADATIEIDLALGSHSDVLWCLVEVTGFDGTGTEVQLVKGNGTASPASVTMAAYSNSANAILSVVALGEFATGQTITGEHTELADLDDQERVQMMVQVQNPATDTTPSATYTEPGSEEHAIVGIEIKAATGGATLEQEGFRARDDDGSESGASWVETQDVDFTWPQATNLRMRFVLNATGDPPSQGYRLQMRRTSGSTTRWMNVGPPPQDVT